jgi:hypothetical protein
MRRPTGLCATGADREIHLTFAGAQTAHVDAISLNAPPPGRLSKLDLDRDPASKTRTPEDMSPFPNTRTKRRTVYTLLLVWFFALGSGWANACLLQASGTHWHGPSADASLIAHVSRVSPGHVGADSDHAENAGPAKSACLKVCSDDTQSIVKLASSADLWDIAAGPPSALAWFAPLDAAALDNVWLEQPAPSPGVPLRTLFSRLAL